MTTTQQLLDNITAALRDGRLLPTDELDKIRVTGNLSVVREGQQIGWIELPSGYVELHDPNVRIDVGFG